MRAGAPYGVVASALRQRWGLTGDDPAASRVALREALTRELPAAELARALEFLGEMCGVLNPDPGAALQAALRDPKLMLAARTRRSSAAGRRAPAGPRRAACRPLPGSGSTVVEPLTFLQ